MIEDNPPDDLLFRHQIWAQGHGKGDGPPDISDPISLRGMTLQTFLLGNQGAD